MIIDYRVESKDKKALMAPFLIPIREENSFDLTGNIKPQAVREEF